MTDTPFKSGFVAVFGRPNVGKSTLLNAILDEKLAIVSPRPNTTRRQQLGIHTADNAQVVFIDTPGINRPRQQMDKFMAASADRALNEAHALLWVVDVSQRPGGGDRFIARRIAETLDEKPAIIAMNKMDLLKPEHVIANTAAYAELMPHAKWMLTTATRKDNLDQLLSMLTDALPEGALIYEEDLYTTSSVRDMAAELIRESALEILREEIPHGLAVQIEEFDESEAPRLTRINAVLYVEQDRHRKIVIGKKGEMLKKIGTVSRKKIEALLDGKLYLELFVKVLSEWRNKEKSVRDMGYRIEDI